MFDDYWVCLLRLRVNRSSENTNPRPTKRRILGIVTSLVPAARRSDKCLLLIITVPLLINRVNLNTAQICTRRDTIKPVF